MKSPIVLLREVLTDVSLALPDAANLEKDLQTFSRRFKNEGYGFLTIALPTLCKALEQGLATGRFACPRNFRRVPGGTIPAFLSGMFCKVFDSQGNLLHEHRIDVVRALRSVLLMWKKMSLNSDQEEILDQKAKAIFIDTDREAALFNPEKFRLALYRRVCSFVLYNLEIQDYSQIKCKHGPGAVAEGYSPNQKWSGVVSDIQNLGYSEHIGLQPFYESFIFNEELMDCVEDNLPLLPVPSGIAKLVTVPKDSQSRRTITVEPSLNMFFQQGLNTILRDCINQDRTLMRCLALNHQEPNQYLALDGSRTGLWATLDLKSASDLLSFELVKITFANRLSFLERLCAARTPVVRVDECQYELSKFAGMGNATTFPVQSVVFALLAITAIHEQWGITPTKESMLRAADSIQVFGDDIIVKTEYCHQVVNWIESFGLKVNRNKSFTEGNFRESCGVDAWCGEEVTPIYLRSRPDLPHLDAEMISSLVSTATQFRLAGWYKTSEQIYLTVEQSLGRELPYGRLDSGYLCRVSVLGYSTATKWCKNLQRFLVKAPIVKSQLRTDPIDGYPALLKFFLTPLLGRGKDHLKRSQKRFSTRISWRWVPI